jgi:hypothetical protein
VKLISHTEGVGKQSAEENAWNQAEELKKIGLRNFILRTSKSIIQSIKSTRSSGMN